MTEDMRSAFGRPNVVEPRRLIREYDFRLEGLSPRIRIRLYEKLGKNGVWFEQSHYIKTPAQLSLYTDSRSWGDDEKYALEQAISSVSDHYATAISDGHEPNDTWLVVNESFK